MKVKDIRPEMENITLTIRVVSVSKPRKVMTRYGEALAASAVVADKTGEIILNLWRGQISLVRPGVHYKNRKYILKTVQHRIELNVGRKGRIIVLKDI